MSLGQDLDLEKDRDQDLLRDLDLDQDCESVGGNLKVHKREKFFVSDFEFLTIL